MEEQLIAAVYKRRAIWDPSDKLRRNANILKSLWIELAHEIGVDVKAAKSKWKNLRAYFMSQTRELDKQKAEGSDGKKGTSTWGFYNQLLFLKDAAKFIENAKDGSLTSMEVSHISKIEVEDYDVDNLINSTEISTDDKDVLPEIVSTYSLANKYASQPGTSNEKQTREEWENNSQIENNASFRIDWANKSKRKPDTRDEENRGREVIGIGKGKVLLLDRDTEEDPDMLFFKSLLPYMRELSPIQKLRIRTNIQNLIIAEYEATM